MASQGAKRTVLRIIAIQLAVTLAIAAVSLMLADGTAAYSALIGGGINIIATAYFAHRVFTAGPGATAKQITGAFYWGEVTKIALTGLLFTAVLLWLNVAFLPLFVTYAATMLAFWIVLPFTL